MITKIHHHQNLTFGYIYKAGMSLTDAQTKLAQIWPDCRWHHANQKHTNNIFHIGSVVPDHADALVTSERNQGLIVYTADCLPIMLANQQTIALIHAGWLGLAQDIVRKSSEKLHHDIATAWIGPHHRSYNRSIHDHTVPDHIRSCAEQDGEHLMLNLKKMAMNQLTNEPQIYDDAECTISDPNLPSYRRGNRGDRLFSFAFRT